MSIFGQDTRPTPQRALSVEERSTVRETLNSERFQDSAPRQVYATLLDEGTYHCSWRTMYRILDEHQEVRERRNQLQHPKYVKPELLATGPNVLWSWDLTKLRGPVDFLLSVHHLGRFQPLRCWLDDCRTRIGHPGRAIDPRNL